MIAPAVDIAKVFIFVSAVANDIVDSPARIAEALYNNNAEPIFSNGAIANEAPAENIIITPTRPLVASLNDMIVSKVFICTELNFSINGKAELPIEARKSSNVALSERLELANPSAVLVKSPAKSDVCLKISDKAA